MAKAPKKNDPAAKDTRGRRKGQRGARAGTTTTPQEHGGSIGQAPYEPTERDREFVKEHAFYASHTVIAKRLGISTRTLTRHFREELETAEENMGIELAQTAAKKAKEGDGPMLRFLLATKFGWNTKVQHQHTGANGGPIRTVDMGPMIEGKTEDELAELEKLLASLGAAAANGSGSEGD